MAAAGRQPRVVYSNLYPSMTPPRRKVFVSYHHGGDQAAYNRFSEVFHGSFQIFQDRSLERARDSNDPSYIMRYIRDNHLYGSSCTIVLCGQRTGQRKFVDWEIYASLADNMGLIGLRLPDNPIDFVNNTCAKPQRLQDNIDSGYAVWDQYDAVMLNPAHLSELIEAALARPKKLIDNRMARRVRNG
jgi:hypothetical protein